MLQTSGNRPGGYRFHLLEVYLDKSFPNDKAQKFNGFPVELAFFFSGQTARVTVDVSVSLAHAICAHEAFLSL